VAEEKKKIRIGQPPPPPRPQPQPAGDMPRPPSIPGVGQMPFPAGKVFLLPEEVATLSKLGWKPGDPIPSNLAKALQAEEEAVRKEMDNAPPPVDPDTPPVVVPRAVPIEALPPERQQALQNLLAGYKQALSTPSQPDAPMQADPSVLAAIQQASAGAGRVNVVDSGTKGGIVIGGNPAPVAPEPTPALPPANLAGAAQSLHHCPRCNFRLSDSMTMVPDENDKMFFLASVLGGKTGRFKKTINLFGGRVQVTFRSLEIAESELCLTQLAYDRRDDQALDYSQAAMRMMDYRLALSLDSYRIGDDFQELPENVDDWEIESSGPGSDKPQTKLPKMVHWLQTNTALRSEVVWRQAGQASLRFEQLFAHLEAKALDPDFWQAIEGAA